MPKFAKCQIFMQYLTQGTCSERILGAISGLLICLQRKILFLWSCIAFVLLNWYRKSTRCCCDLFIWPKTTLYPMIADWESCESCHLAPFSASAWKLWLSKVLVWSVISQDGCPASGQRVDPFDECFKQGIQSGREEGEAEDKSWFVFQGLIMRAVALVSWMLCLCWRESLQADVANEGGGVVCWHSGGQVIPNDIWFQEEIFALTAKIHMNLSTLGNIK